MQAGRPPHISLLLYPRAQMSAVLGLADLFSVADRLGRRRLGIAGPLLRVTQCEIARDNGSATFPFDSAPQESGPPDVVILPPSLGDPPAGPSAPPLVEWLRASHRRGAVLASVCAGAFLLGETGLLDGRVATTHWGCAQDLADRFPRIHVDADKLLIDDGDLITAGGLMAWTDLGLRLVDRLLGAGSMMETARFLLIDPPGREQRNYSAFSPRLSHGDASIMRVQDWLRANGAHGATLTAMAAQAGLEERTFLRRFRSATGLRPIEYCQQLRIGAARDLLKGGKKAIDQIAWEVGYGDPASFRKLFLKITGLSPSDYRRRFSQFGQMADTPLSEHR